MASFEQEALRAVRRRRSTSAAGPAQPPSGPFTFQSYQVSPFGAVASRPPLHPNSVMPPLESHMSPAQGNSFPAQLCAAPHVPADSLLRCLLHIAQVLQPGPRRLALTPPPSQALALLHRLAADPGIRGVMAKHQWSVGLLSEMPPGGTLCA